VMKRKDDVSGDCGLLRFQFLGRALSVYRFYRGFRIPHPYHKVREVYCKQRMRDRSLRHVYTTMFKAYDVKYWEKEVLGLYFLSKRNM